MIRLVLLMCLALSARAETLTGFVVGIADGDTITVLDARRQQHKIRLAGIDAPEKGQPFGDRSKQNLAAMVFNKSVNVEWDKQDRYGRTVGKVMVNGVDANLEQVKAGQAWWYEQYRREQSPEDQRRYANAEQDARVRRVGLWRDSLPVAPWDFRHGTGPAAVEQSCPCGGPVTCTGTKGGHYCTMANGSKSYGRK